MSDSGSAKIAGAIVAAALILLLGGIGYFELEKHRVAKALEVFSQQMKAESAAVAKAGRQQQLNRERAALDDRRARRLNSGERCVGGSVIRTGKSGSTREFQQVLEQGKPVACNGVYRLSTPR